MPGPPVARISADTRMAHELAVRRRLVRPHPLHEVDRGAVALSASRMISPVASPTPWALRWQLRMIALRAFSAISVLLANVGTGLVIGTRAKITPTGSAISLIPSSSSVLRIPAPTWPSSTRDGHRSKLILVALCVDVASVVSATVRSASSTACALIDVAMSSSSASTRSSGQSRTARPARPRPRRPSRRRRGRARRRPASRRRARRRRAGGWPCSGPSSAGPRRPRRVSPCRAGAGRRPPRARASRRRWPPRWPSAESRRAAPPRRGSRRCTRISSTGSVSTSCEGTSSRTSPVSMM